MELQELIKSADLRRMAQEAGAQFSEHGNELRSACPLHGGDNESAFVIWPKAGNGEKDLWRCYTGCDRGGDALHFFMAWKGIQDYEIGIKDFARYLNIELDWQPDPAQIEKEKQRQARADVLDVARKFYQSQLWSEKGTQALAYLHNRGFQDATIHQAGWGFSDSSAALIDFLRSKGADLETAFEIGLVRHDLADFTANKKGKEFAPNGYIVFPHMVYQRCIYFSARAVEIEGQKLPDPNESKRNLPGSKQIYRADCTGKAASLVIIVEGPSDAETLRQVGFTAWSMNGLSGMNDEDLEDLKARKAVYIAVDSDKAGQEKIEKEKSKLTALCQALGPLTMVMPPLPQGKDFNAWLRSNKPVTTADVNNLIKASKTWFEHRLMQARDCSPIERDERMVEIGQLLASTPEASRSWFFNQAHEILGMTKKELTDLVNTALGRNNGHALSEIHNRQLVFAGKTLGNFWAKITEELSREDGFAQPEIRFKVNGGLMDGRNLKEVEIEFKEFYAMQWIPRDWGFGPILYVNRGGLFELARAIQEVSTNVLRKRVFTYTGWTEIDGKRVYLSSAGSISAEGLDPSTLVDLGNNNFQHYQLPEIPEGGAAYQAVKASLDFLKVGNRSITAMLWTAMYCAPLTAIKPLTSILWVYGLTQSGKSTVSHLALTHFGPDWIDGHRYRAPIEFSQSTFAAIENAAFMVKDAPLILDDFAPNFASPNEAKKLHTTAHAVVRIVGNRSGKSRSDANLKQRQTRPPRGLVLVTAENPLTGQSTVGRIIYVPIARGEIVPDRDKTNTQLNEAQKNAAAGLYAQAMSLYVQWLAMHWEKVQTELGQAVEKWAEWLRTKDKIQGRLPDDFGLLVAGQDLALAAFEEMDFITAKDRETISEENREAIRQLIVRQAEMVSLESPVRKSSSPWAPC